MRATVLRGPALALLLAGMILTLAVADQPTAEEDKKPAPMQEKPPPPVPFSPALAVYDDLYDVVRLVPRAVVLAPEKYQGLLDEIDRLKKQLERPGPRSPSRIVLKGKVEGNLVHLAAQFEFDTEKPGEVIRLGCGLARATGVSLDGKTPRLRNGGRGREDVEGFLVEVDKPGEHHLTLDLVLALSAIAPGNGFTLDLPRAAITNLELELPAGAGELRIGGKPLSETLLTRKGRQLSGGLGPVEKLEVSWSATASRDDTGAVLAVEGLVVARFDGRDLVTEAQLTLRVVSGQVKQWHLVVPRNSEFKYSPTDEARIARPEVAKDQKQVVGHTIHLKEATSAPLAVTVLHRRPAPKAGVGKQMPIGPFNVRGASRHSGSVLVCNSVPDWHLEFTPRADLTRRAPTEEERTREPDLVAAFRYGPGDEGDGNPRSPRGLLSWLDVEVEAVKGQIKAKPSHLLTLHGDGKEGLRWRVQTTYLVTPRWADVDRFVVQMPEDCEVHELVNDPKPERVRDVRYDPKTRRMEFRLVRGGEAALTPFTVRVEAVYNPSREGKTLEKESLELPRPILAPEQDGTITVQTPTRIELLGSEQDQSAEVQLLRHANHEAVWRYPRRTPERFEVAWQPYRPLVQVASLADLTLLPAEVQVRQEFRYLLPAATEPPRLALRLPAGIAANVQLREGGRSLVLGATLGGYQSAVVVPNDGRNPVLVFEYVLPLPATKPGEAVNLPLIVPENVTRGETKVRVWSEAGVFPVAGDGWREQNVEVVNGRDRLPVLVLRGERIDQPLALTLSESEPELAALIERALVRVEVAANGVQSYRVSYRLLRLATTVMELELPAQAAALGLQVTLDGRALNPELRGKLIRLRLSPDLVRKPATLEIVYRLDPGRLPATPLTTNLAAPRLSQEANGIPTRWQVTLPPTQVVLWPEAGPGGMVRWGLRGWLPAPRQDVTAAQLERWLSGKDAGTAQATSQAPTLVVWHDGSELLRVMHAPQQLWLLACSLTLVLVGLLGWRLSSADRRASPWFWLVWMLCVLAAVVALFLWPTLTGQLAYGSLPGAAVLLVLGVVQWLLHERSRRQIVFLPSFSRTRPGSSLMRGQPAVAAQHGEPSTVDAPPTRPVGSSINRTS